MATSLVKTVLIYLANKTYIYYTEKKFYYFKKTLVIDSLNKRATSFEDLLVLWQNLQASYSHVEGVFSVWYVGGSFC